MVYDFFFIAFKQNVAIAILLFHKWNHKLTLKFLAKIKE